MNPDFTGETFLFQLQGDSLNHAAPDPAILRLACFVVVDDKEVLLGNCFLELFEIEDRLLTGQKVPAEMTFLKPQQEVKVGRLQISLQLQSFDKKGIANGLSGRPPTQAHPSSGGAPTLSASPALLGMSMSQQHDGFMAETAGPGFLSAESVPARAWIYFLVRSISNIDENLTGAGLELKVLAMCGLRQESSVCSFTAPGSASTLAVPVSSTVIQINQSLLVGVPVNTPSDRDTGTVLHVRLMLTSTTTPKNAPTTSDIQIELEGMSPHHEYTADVQFADVSYGDSAKFGPRMFLTMCKRPSIVQPSSPHLTAYGEKYVGRLELIVQDLEYGAGGDKSQLMLFAQVSALIHLGCARSIALKLML